MSSQIIKLNNVYFKNFYSFSGLDFFKNLIYRIFKDTMIEEKKNFQIHYISYGKKEQKLSYEG